MDNEFIKLLASVFSQKTGGDAEQPAHLAQAAASFTAAVQMIEGALGEGKNLENEIRARAQQLIDLADLIKASKTQTQ